MANQGSQHLNRQDRIYVEAYEKEKCLGRWLEAHGLTRDLCNDLPNIGYMAFHDDSPVAVIFLRLVEGRMGIIDGLCTDPKARPDIRNRAIDLLVERVMERAKELEFKKVIAWSQDAHTLERSLKHGFERMPDSMIFYKG